MAFTWAENITVGVAIKASHLTELQNNVDICDGLVCYGENSSNLVTACSGENDQHKTLELWTNNGDRNATIYNSELASQYTGDYNDYDSSELGSQHSGFNNGADATVKSTQNSTIYTSVRSAEDNQNRTSELWSYLISNNNPRYTSEQGMYDSGRHSGNQATENSGRNVGVCTNNYSDVNSIYDQFA